MEPTAPADNAPVVVLVTIILPALILYWVYLDSTRREAYPPLWFAALAFSGLFVHWFAVPLGALIYLLVRPKGRLLRCPHCGKLRLESLVTCPHCGGHLRKECYRCHAAIPVEAGECPECGART